MADQSSRLLGRLTAPIRRYTRWLHTGWPAGTVEHLPVAGDDGSTAVPGVYLVGDLTGIPLLKFSADSGAKAVATILDDSSFEPAKAPSDDLRDLVILGAGVAGMAAALEARDAGLDFVVFEASEPFSTVANFPKAKPIYTYPTDMVNAGDMRFRADVKEGLLRELREQTIEKGIIPQPGRATRVRRKNGVLVVALEGGREVRARRVIVAIGRSGDHRRLGIPGEDLDKVSNRLHDPADFTERDVAVVGGGDSAVEAAVALADAGARVTLVHRREEFTRPKPDNLAALSRARETQDLHVLTNAHVDRCDDDTVSVQTDEGVETLPNDALFTLIGREAPLEFFRRSGIPIHGEWRTQTKVSFALIMALALFVYHWKTSAGIPIYDWFRSNGWFPFNLGEPTDPATVWGTLRLSATSPGFYYTLAYSLGVLVFGIARIRRRKTPYVTAQTITLVAIQVIPLFLLPYLILPWIGHNGGFDAGFAKTVADGLFPETQWDAHGREYWRAFGLILAWPLMFWNVFSDQPLVWWLTISFVQTFVIIPIIIRYWGKGAYCGWVCSCGALAETVGDTLRTRMPHGPLWNRMNMVGQGVLVMAFLILIFRIVSWTMPDSTVGRAFEGAYMATLLGKDASWASLPFPFTFLNYQWVVDVTMAGIIGVGFYMHFSGRVWCRFGCPLAALMHIYTRFSRFRILADKKKCISCNVCTTVCHQGIDVMSFANKGEPMADVQCVRCSACVQSCPTGVLEFGQIDPKTGEVLSVDVLAASPVKLREAD